MKTLAPKTNSVLQNISRHKLIYSAVSVALILALIIPPIVVFGVQRHGTPPMSAIIVPLYIYPSPGAWNLLYEAITTHPNLNFKVVVNPHSGPGDGPVPDANYLREIPRLNSYTNVQTLGYISTKYTTRDIASVKEDIHTYAEWRANATVPGLSVQGIFFDETPSVYNDASGNFLHEIHGDARQAQGFGPNCTLIDNPGTIPDARYLDGPDSTVVFEGTYDTYQQHGISSKLAMLGRTPRGDNDNAARSSTPLSRGELVCIMHSVPRAVACDQSAMGKVVRELRGLAGTVFMTELADDQYHSFGACWMSFVNATA